MPVDAVENAPEPIPRLYALHRDDDEEGGPPTVVAWGLAFADGSAVTLWTDPYPGAVVATGRLRNVEALYARYVDAYLVWLTGVPIKEGFARRAPVGRIKPAW